MNTPHPYDLVIGLDRSDRKALKTTQALFSRHTFRLLSVLSIPTSLLSHSILHGPTARPLLTNV